MIYRTRIFKIVLSKLYTVSKDANVILIVMRPPTAQSQNLKYNLEQLGKIFYLMILGCLSQRVTDRQTEVLRVVWELLTMSVLINQFVLPTFCLCFAFTGINFRGMLHHVCDVAYDENMCGPIRTRKCRSINWLINYTNTDIIAPCWNQTHLLSFIFYFYIFTIIIKIQFIFCFQKLARTYVHVNIVNCYIDNIY